MLLFSSSSKKNKRNSGNTGDILGDFFDIGDQHFDKRLHQNLQSPFKKTCGFWWLIKVTTFGRWKSCDQAIQPGIWGRDWLLSLTMKSEAVKSLSLTLKGYMVCLSCLHTNSQICLFESAFSSIIGVKAIWTHLAILATEEQIGTLFNDVWLTHRSAYKKLNCSLETIQQQRRSN